MSTHVKGKLTEIVVDSAAEALDKITGKAAPTKHEIQQLKSVRDDLCNKFRDNDKLIQGYPVTTTAIYRRSKRLCSKLTAQITAINSIIKYLETKTS